MKKRGNCRCCREVSSSSRADQHPPEQFTAQGVGAACTANSDSLGTRLRGAQPRTSLTPLPSCCRERPLSAQPNDTVQTQGSLTPSQLVLVVLPCSAGSCLTEYRTISSAAAAES